MKSRSLSLVHLKDSDKDYQKYSNKDEDFHEQTTELVEEQPEKIILKCHNSEEDIEPSKCQTPKFLPENTVSDKICF